MEKPKNRGNRPPPRPDQQDGSFRKKKRPKDRSRGKPGSRQGSGGPVQPELQGRSKSGAPQTSGVPAAPGAAFSPKQRNHPPQKGQRHPNADFNGDRQDRHEKARKPHKEKNNGLRDRSPRNRSELALESRLKFQEALEAEEKTFKHAAKRYAVLLYDNLAQAHQNIEHITEQSLRVDQLNVVIRAESDMDDPILSGIPKVKVFAGAAWTTIHERRMEDGWYNQPQ